MFEERALPAHIDELRSTYAANTQVFDCATEFETLDARGRDELAIRVDSVDPLSYPRNWIPEDAPSILTQLAESGLVIGFPEHGSVTWTRQTVPPTVLVRPRSHGSPGEFVDFLVAEAFVEIGAGHPEHFLGFFEDRYGDIAAFGTPSESYQIAAALFDAYIGLHTREIYVDWVDRYPQVHQVWEETGERLAPRLDDLVAAVNRGETTVTDATEYACSAVKHNLALPPPFDALDSVAYREYGADFAVKWVERILPEFAP